MKRGILFGALVTALSIAGAAADFSGYVIDESCAAKPAMKGNEACARKCIKGGSPAGLLTGGGKGYKAGDQAKAVGKAGHKGKRTGETEGETSKTQGIK